MSMTLARLVLLGVLAQAVLAHHRTFAAEVGTVVVCSDRLTHDELTWFRQYRGLWNEGCSREVVFLSKTLCLLMVRGTVSGLVVQ
jgi:hypothetical protein